MRQTGARVITLRAGFPYEMIDQFQPDLLFLSPGPKTPQDQQVPQLVGEAVRRQLPVFGVCLGHQGIAEHFGGHLLTFAEPCHGQPSDVYHEGTGLFAGLPQPFQGGRYHSLYVNPEQLPAELEVTARTDSGGDHGATTSTTPDCFRTVPSRVHSQSTKTGRTSLAR